MMYLVDFFGTVFNHHAFNTAVGMRDSYEAGELAQFIYPDAATFLREKENSAMIITSGSKVHDGSLVQSALHGIPRTSVIYTEGVPKGEYLAPFIDLYGTSPVFLDDSSEQLASMATFCPKVQLFQMCRTPEQKGDGRWPVIRTLSELP